MGGAADSSWALALTAATLGVALALSACGPGAGPSRPRTSVPPTVQSPTAPSPTPAEAARWPEYHGGPGRSGSSPSTPALGTLAVAWRAPLDGPVWAEPLVVGGRVIVATENDSLYALNPADGAVVWRDHVGTPVPESALPCGDVFPLGMTGTPAYDPATNSIFVVAEETGAEHVLYAFDASTGQVRWSRRADIEDPSEHPFDVQQRTALAIAGGYVYFGYGGLDGDCGQYRGAVIGVPTSGRGPTVDYVLPTSREGAVWATPGPVVDGQGDLFVSTGNGAAESGSWDHTDSVLELSQSLHLLGGFAPSRWAYDNAHDLDLGSVGPTLLPNGLVFIAGKSGLGYVLRGGDLGGVGGQLASGAVCDGQMAFGGTAFNGDTVYLPCANGLEAISVARDGRFSERWQAPAAADGPPVLGGGSVFSVATSDGTLLALRAATGSVQARIGVGAVEHFCTPAVDGSLLLVPTDSGVTAVSGA